MDVVKPRYRWQFECVDPGCRAAAIGAGESCFPHADDLSTQKALDEFSNGGGLDLRGSTLNRETLDTILGAAPTANEGKLVKNLDCSWAVFEEWVDFSRCTVWNARFQRAVFREGASFVEATMHGAANFAQSLFVRRARFQRATFFGSVSFGGARFTEYAEFFGVRFRRGARFIGCHFESGCDFTKLHNLSDARTLWNFENIINERTFRLSLAEKVSSQPTVPHRPSLELRMTGSHLRGTVDLATSSSLRSLDLVGATLYGFLRIQATDCSLNLAGTTLLAGGHVNADRSRLKMARITTQQPLTVSSNDRSLSVATMEDADVAGLVLRDVDLGRCRLKGAHNLPGLRCEVEAFYLRHTFLGVDRRVIAEEWLWRSSARKRSWPLPWTGTTIATDPVKITAIEIAETYRGLRRGREEAGDEPGAADFYFGEMEMRRLATPRSSGERVLLGAYWLLSGYGLRAARALGVLVATVTGAALLLRSHGFVSGPVAGQLGDQSLGESLTYAWASATLLFSGFDQPLTTTGQVIRILLRVLGPALIGLAALAIRGRVRR